ncbi:hypothetical protein ABPG74_010578 [Tetrahymena malaccensis]
MSFSSQSPSSSTTSQDTNQTESNYVLVSTLAQCTIDNLFGCMENLILLAVALVSVAYGFMALRNIMKDRNQILDFWDKVTMYIAFFQVVMAAVFFGFYNSQIWHFSIRTLIFGNSILICQIVFLIQELSDSMKANIDKMIKITFGYLFGLWFFCGFLHKNTPEAPYNCMRMDWMLISGSNFILSCIQAYATVNIIQFIQNQSKPEVGYTEEGIQNYSKDDCENRKVQLPGLLIGVLLPSFLLFIWDYISHTHAEKLVDCNEFYFASSFFTLIIFVFVKTICYFLGPWSIFFVFYWKNRSYINTVQDNPNKEFFFDRRSELIEKQSF